MKPSSGPAPPNDPPPRPSPALRDFIRAAAPKGAPAEELTQRFREARARETARSLIMPGPPKDSTEYFVERRIREGMMRKEREAADIRRQMQAREKNDKKPPPAP